MSGFFNILNQFSAFVSYIIYVVSSMINNLSSYLMYVFQVTNYMPDTIKIVVSSYIVLGFLYMIFFHKWGNVWLTLLVSYLYMFRSYKVVRLCQVLSCVSWLVLVLSILFWGGFLDRDTKYLHYAFWFDRYTTEWNGWICSLSWVCCYCPFRSLVFYFDLVTFV